MSKNMTQSAAMYERARELMPGGVSRNTVLRKPHPQYAVKGNGCWVTDVEGERRIDFANNMAALIHGHAHPLVVEAVHHQMMKGTSFTMATEQEIRYAEHMVWRIPSVDMIRFVNSGTEAVMGCLKAARAYTGRPKIAKAEGAYHGLYDYAEVSQLASPDTWGEIDNPERVPVSHGTPQSTLDDVVVIPFNDPERAVKILDKYADQLACVLLDVLPHRVGLFAADPEFVRTVRNWCDANGALLVFDEVVTFRTEYAGAQQRYDVAPDLTALGKLIGGGFPVGALGGKREIMEVMNPLADKVLLPHSGTFSANPITMVAGMAAMSLYDREAVAHVNDLGERCRRGIAEAISISGAPACVTGEGSMFRVHMKREIPNNYRATYMGPKENERLQVVLNHLFDNNVMMINTCSGAISTVMTAVEIDRMLEAMLGALRKIKDMES